jgi:hypothetical protein
MWTDWPSWKLWAPSMAVHKFQFCKREYISFVGDLISGIYKDPSL